MAAITGGTGPGGFELNNGSSTLALWLDGSDPLATGTPPANGANIAVWEDKSGYSRDVNVLLSGQPTFLAADSAVNDTGAVRFVRADGVADIIRTTHNFDSLGANYSIFAVSRFAGPNHQRVITSETRNWLLGHHNPSTEGYYFEGGPYQRGPNDESGRIYTALVGPNVDGVAGGSVMVDFWANGTQIDSDSTNVNQTVYKPGQIRLGGQYNQDSDANISEIVIVDRAVNDAERKVILNSLSAKFNLGIGAQDLYAGDDAGTGNYDRNVFGIGGVALAPTNVALGKPAFQSSEYGGFPASFAVDGNNGNFTHTASGDAAASWKVNLGNAHGVTSVLLRNRGDGCCQYRFRDLTVEFWNGDPAVVGSTLVHQSPLLNPGNVLNGPASITYTPPPATTANWVRVLRTATTGGGPDDNNVLSLGEVEVNSDLVSVLTAGQSGFGVETTSVSDAGDSIAAGHKTAVNSSVTTDLPAGVANRWDRVWFVDKTDPNNNLSSQFHFDFSDAGLLGPGSTTFYLLYHATNSFESSETPFQNLSLTPTVVGDRVSFTVPAATLADGYYTLGVGPDVTLQAPAANGVADDFRLVRNGGNLEFYANSVLTWAAPFSGLNSVTVNGSTDNDRLQVDFAAGDALPAGGVFFNGGEQAGDNDRMEILGGSATTIRYTPTDPGAISANGVFSIDGQLVTFTGLEPTLVTTTMANLIIDLSSLALGETVTLVDSGGANGQFDVDFTNNNLEDVTVVNPSLTLQVIGSNQNDVLTVTSLDAAFAAAIDINLGAGAADDVNLNAPLSLGANSIAVTAETIDVGAVAITTAAGNQTYTGALSLSGSTLTTGAGAVILGGNVSVPAGVPSSIAGNLNLGGATRTFTVADVTASAATDLTISAIISNGGLTKDGAGTLVLSGNNTFAAGLTLNAGTVNGQTNFNGAVNTNPFGTGTLTNNNASVIVSQGSAATAPRGATGNLTMSWFDTGAASAQITNIGNNTATGGLLGVVPLGSKLLAGAVSFVNDAAFQASTATPGAGVTLTAADNYMFLYRGYFTPAVTGTYQFGVGNQVGGAGPDDENAIYLDINGDGLFNTAAAPTSERAAYGLGGGASNAGAVYSLTAGVAYPIVIATREGSGGSVLNANVQRTSAPVVAWTNINSGTGSGVGTFTAQAAANNAAFSLGNAVSVTGTATFETQVPGVSFGALSAAAGSTVNMNGTGFGVNQTIAFSSATLAAAATLNTNTASGLISGVVSQTAAALFTKGGANRLTLSGANTYTGDTNIAAGTVAVGNNSAFGTIAGNTTVASGATLQINGFRIGPDGNEPLFVAGTGVGGIGALLNTRTAATLGVIRNLTLTADATFNSTSRFDIRDDGADPVVFDMANFALTKIGGGDLAVVNATINNEGNVNVNAGIFRLEGSTDFDGLARTISVANTATLDFFGNTQTHDVNVTLAGGANLTANGGALTNTGATVTGLITLNGVANVNTVNNTLRLTGQITGVGGITKGGANTLTLTNDTSNYAGVNTFNAGTVIVTANNALGTTAGGTAVASGATLRFDATAGALTPAAEPLALAGVGVVNQGALQSVGNNVTLSGPIVLTGNTFVASHTAARTLTLNGAINKSLDADLTLMGPGDFVSTAPIADKGFSLAPFTARVFNGVQQNIADPTIITNDINGTTVASRMNTLNGPLTFANAAAFNALFTPSIPLVDNFTTVFETTLTVVIPGVYTFAVTNNDDGAAAWLKPSANAAFVAGDLLQGIVANNNTAVATRMLAAGTYTLVYAHREGVGGEAVTGRITGPGLVGVTNGTLLPIVNPVAGTNNLTKNGAGTATLSGANTYSGLTTVNAGILVAANNTALGTGPGGTNVERGASLVLQGGITISGEAIRLDGVGAPGQLGVLVNQSGTNTIAATSPISARLANLGEIRLASVAGSLVVNSPINLNSSRLSVDGAGDTSLTGAISGANATFGAPLAPAVSGVFTNVAEAGGYSLALEHNNLPNNIVGTVAFPYTVNNTASLGAYDRIAYYMELTGPSAPGGSAWAYVSMDAFTANIGQIGVPNAPALWTFQQFVSNLNVVASVGSGITTGVGLTTGNIEIWPSNYSQGNTLPVPNASSAGTNDGFDFGDGGFNTTVGYGSFQFHNYDIDGVGGAGVTGQTILAYNNWHNATLGDVGIGNRGVAGQGNDWTFSNNLPSYTVKRLAVLVREATPAFRQSDNSLVKNGGGVLTLTGLNTYAGTTNVNAGRLVLNNGAPGGAIADGAGAVTVANGATLQLDASETVSAFTGDATSTLILAANTLTVNTGNVLIGNVTTANGGITAVAGAIVDNNAAAMNVTGTGIVLQSATGVGTAANPLESTITAVEATGGTGGVFLTNTGSLTIGGLSPVIGVSANGDDILISTTGSLAVNENVTATNAGNEIVLSAIDSAGPGQDLTLGANVVIQATGSTVTLNAGDAVTVPLTARLAATGNVVINVDAGVADPGLGGSLSFAGDIDAPLAIFNGSSDSVGDAFNTIRPDQDVGDVLTPIQVNGFGPPMNPNGDSLVLNITGLGIPVLTLGPGLRNGSFSFGTLAAPLTYTDIENISTNPALPYHLVLDMRFSGFQNGAADTILARLNAAGDELLLDVNGANVFTGPDNVIQSLTIIGSADDDALTIQETAGGLPQFLGGAPVVNNTGIGGGVSNGSHLNGSADLLMETLAPGGSPWNAADVTLHFDGGAAGTDSLTLNRTTFNFLLGYFSDAADAGNSGNLASPFGPFLLSFANLEPLVLNGAGGTLATDATSTPATANLTITDVGAATQIVGDGGFATTTLAGFTDLLVNGGDGSELIDLVSIDPATLTLVRLSGGNISDSFSQPGGDTAADTLRIRSLPATMQALMFGAAGSDLFQLYDAGNTVDNIAGLVNVDGADGNVGGNTDTLTIINTGGATADNLVIDPLDTAASDAYTIDGLTTVAGNDVIFRNIDDLNYTGTALADTIDGRFLNTVPAHDLTVVNLNGSAGTDQFLLFTSDQIGGTGANNTPTGVASGVANINLFGNADEDIFGATPPAPFTGTGAMNVGLVVSDDLRMIRPSASTAIAIDGGTPTGLAAPLGDVVGDVLNVNVTQLPNSTPVIVSTFSPGTVVATGIQPLTWVEIEDINLVDQGKLTNVQMGDLFARTTPNPDLVQITRNPTALNPNQVRLRITATIGNYSASNKTIVYAGAMNDTITQANLTIPAEFYGEEGNDYLSGAMNNDWLVGGLGNDRINGSGGDNVIWGDNAPTNPGDLTPQDGLNGGDDTLSGLGGNDVFYGGAGNDLVSAGGGNDYAYGGEGNDTLDGHDGDDRLYGGAGNDVLSGHAGNDLLSGAAGDDRMYGSTGNDVLFGGTGADLIDGGEGSDLLVSGSVANELSSWTSAANTTTFNAATYTLGTDNDAALLTLLAAWASTSNRGTLGTSPAITHDGANDDLWGGTGGDDFCWETADILDNFPGLTPPDYNAQFMGTDERFGPT